MTLRMGSLLIGGIALLVCTAMASAETARHASDAALTLAMLAAGGIGGLLGWWLFYALCLKGAASRTELRLDLSECLKLSAGLTLLSAAVLGVCIFLVHDRALIVIPMVILASLIAGAAMLQRALGCGWKQVLKVYTLSKVTCELVLLGGLFCALYFTHAVPAVMQALNSDAQSGARPLIILDRPAR